MEQHKAAVAEIAVTVRSFFDRQEPYRIFHGSTNSTRPASRDTRSVDISALSHVISVNAATRTALVEPNVSMDRLIEHTLPHGLVPPVVMEFPGITAGGGFAGTAGESSSFRHGFFDDTVRRVEMVLADGEVVNAEPEGQRADLFRGAAGAVGTLGITTLLELRLVEAKRYVRVRYRRVRSVAGAVSAVQEEAARPENDYVDGILFSREHGVIIAGSLTDHKPAGVAAQTFSGAWDPWFYLHARDKTRDISPRVKDVAPPNNDADDDDVVDYIPLAEYLFRYDRAGFWVGQAGFQYFWMLPFNRLTRWFLDDFLHTRVLYRALHASGESARFIAQDVAMPFETAAKFIDYTAADLNIWPLWLCPLKRRGPPTFHPFTTPPPPAPPPEILPSNATKTPLPKAENGVALEACLTGPEQQQQQQQQQQQSWQGPEQGPEMMLNIGVWGWGPKSPAAFLAVNRKLEATVRSLGGMKWLYAHTYYPPEEFWPAYGGRAWYDALRAKYRASGLPTVWDKVHVDLAAATAGRRHWLKSVAPIGGLWGMWKGLRSGDLFIHRRSAWKWKGEEEEGKAAVAGQRRKDK